MQPTPSRMRCVAEASAPSSVSESGLGLAPRLSPTQIDPKSGFASTFAASASISATVVTPKKTPRCGSVKPMVGLVGRVILFTSRRRFYSRRGNIEGAAGPELPHD